MHKLEGRVESDVEQGGEESSQRRTALFTSHDSPSVVVGTRASFGSPHLRAAVRHQFLPLSSTGSLQFLLIVNNAVR
jgi:hypothetical protein